MTNIWIGPIQYKRVIAAGEIKSVQSRFYDTDELWFIPVFDQMKEIEAKFCLIEYQAAIEVYNVM